MSLSLVDIVITTYNSEKYIIDLLKSIKKQNYKNYNCIVIDDVSTDSTCDIVKGFAWVNLIENRKNVGASKNKNTASKCGKGKYIVFLDADTYLEDEDWIGKAVKKLGMKTNCTQLGTQIVSGFDKDIILDCGIVMNGIFPEAKFYKMNRNLINNAHLEERKIMGACTAGTIVKRKEFEEVGGFDNKYFYLCEDLDLSLRFILAGYDVIYHPGLVTIHYESQSMKKRYELKDYLINRNLLFILFDNYSVKYLMKCLPKLAINYTKVMGKSIILKESKKHQLIIMKSVLSLFYYAPKIVMKRMKVNRFAKIKRNELININNSLNERMNINTIIFQLTNKCNADCSFCFLHETINDKLKLLSKEELFKIFSSIKGLKDIILTGGEPMLRNDLGEICTFLTKTFPKVGITIPTNGYFTEKIYDVTKEILSGGCRKLKISFSLDGNEEFHDKNRKVEGIFNKVKESYDKIEKLKQIYGKGLEIQVNTAVCKDNVKQLDFLKKYIKREMPLATWTVEPIRGNYNNENTGGLNIKEWKIVATKVEECGLGELYDKSIETIENEKRDWNCNAGSEMISIDYFGNISPCEILKPIINVRDLNYDLNKLYFNSNWNERICSIKNKGCYCTHFCWLSNGIEKRDSLINQLINFKKEK